MSQPVQAKIYLEVCVDTAELAEAALKGGADAIEICRLTADGGITPDISLVDSISRLVMQRNNCPIVTIRIRPRTGNFVYSDKEFQTMLNDIVVFKEFDCVQGFSLAVLTESGSVDVDRMNILMAAIKPEECEHSDDSDSEDCDCDVKRTFGTCFAGALDGMDEETITIALEDLGKVIGVDCIRSSMQRPRQMFDFHELLGSARVVLEKCDPAWRHSDQDEFTTLWKVIPTVLLDVEDDTIDLKDMQVLERSFLELYSSALTGFNNSFMGRTVFLVTPGNKALSTMSRSEKAVKERAVRKNMDAVRAIAEKASMICSKHKRSMAGTYPLNYLLSLP